MEEMNQLIGGGEAWHWKSMHLVALVEKVGKTMFEDLKL